MIRRFELTDPMLRYLDNIGCGLSGLDMRGGTPSPTRALERRGLARWDEAARKFVLTDTGSALCESRWQRLPKDRR